MKARRIANIALVMMFMLVPTGNAAPATFDCSTVTQIPQIECEALVTLYNDMDGSNWTCNTNPPAWYPWPPWLTSNTPCEKTPTGWNGGWYGITCEAGHVTAIALRGNNLNGAIPSEISHFPRLKWLLLRYNQLDGPIPAEIGSLKNLSHLQLEGCHLTGPIPPELGNLAKLEELSLDYNQLEGPIPHQLGNLTNLEVLSFGRNPLSGRLPRSLMNITGLRRLDFQATSVCEHRDGFFQLWLAKIKSVRGTGLKCDVKSYLPEVLTGARSR